MFFYFHVFRLFERAHKNKGKNRRKLKNEQGTECDLVASEGITLFRVCPLFCFDMQSYPEGIPFKKNLFLVLHMDAGLSFCFFVIYQRWVRLLCIGQTQYAGLEPGAKLRTAIYMKFIILIHNPFYWAFDKSQRGLRALVLGTEGESSDVKVGLLLVSFSHYVLLEVE